MKEIKTIFLLVFLIANLLVIGQNINRVKGRISTNVKQEKKREPDRKSVV